MRVGSPTQSADLQELHRIQHVLLRQLMVIGEAYWAELPVSCGVSLMFGPGTYFLPGKAAAIGFVPWP